MALSVRELMRREKRRREEERNQAHKNIQKSFRSSSDRRGEQDHGNRQKPGDPRVQHGDHISDENSSLKPGNEGSAAGRSSQIESQTPRPRSAVTAKARSEGPAAPLSCCDESPTVSSEPTDVERKETRAGTAASGIVREDPNVPSGLPADFFDEEVEHAPTSVAPADLDVKNEENDDTPEAQGKVQMGRGEEEKTKDTSSSSVLETFLREVQDVKDDGVEVFIEIEEPSVSLLQPIKKERDSLELAAGPLEENSGTTREILLQDRRTATSGVKQERAGDPTSGCNRDDTGGQHRRKLLGRLSENDSKPEKDEEGAHGPPVLKAENPEHIGDAVDASREHVEKDEVSSSIDLALLASTAVDEIRWYKPYATVLHSELLHEEEELEELRARVESTALRRAAARQDASAGVGTKAGMSGKKKKKGGGADTGTSEKDESNSSVNRNEEEDRQAGKDGDGDELPIGFFDDEERDAEARGLVGTRKLKEMIKRIEEKRREVADDLQRRKEDLVQQRRDVRRFFQGVEEQASDLRAYTARVRELRELRQRQTLKKEGEDGAPHSPAASKPEDRHPVAKKEEVKTVPSPIKGEAPENSRNGVQVKSETKGDATAASGNSKYEDIRTEKERKDDTAAEDDEEEESNDEDEEDDDEFVWRAKSLVS
ncbi:hypothetical protein CSUI_002041 [Cystoisospora suis]|uniref:Uncharacterized protein n=1 Tax=Cystoisospora suis TaxID=483139 RepID=A0A2C6LAE7_9APIC|nr:hypothetical protein CSUI_002041 [Cystoisospora suis]